jgi:excisionase family DNA binding protein
MKTKAPDSRALAPQFLSRSEAAIQIGMTTQFIDRLLVRGVLNTYRFGRRVRLQRGEFDAWVKARRETTQQ